MARRPVPLDPSDDAGAAGSSASAELSASEVTGPLEESDLPPPNAGTLRPLDPAEARSASSMPTTVPKPPTGDIPPPAPLPRRTGAVGAAASSDRASSSRPPRPPDRGMGWVAAAWLPIAPAVYFLAQAQPPSTYGFFDRLGTVPSRAHWDSRSLMMAAAFLGLAGVVSTLGVFARSSAGHRVPGPLLAAAAASTLGLVGLATAVALL